MPRTRPATPREEAIAASLVLVGVDDLLDPGDALVAVERRALDPLAPARSPRRSRSRRLPGRAGPSISAGVARGSGAAENSSSSATRAAPTAAAASSREPGVGEVGAVGVADPVADPGPHADAALGRLGEALDLAAVDADLAARAILGARPRRRRRRRRAPPRPRGRARARAELGSYRRPADRHRPRSGRGPGRCRPAPVWPALPQKPVFISKSLPTASIARQRLEAVADQGRAAAGPGHLAALDQVALGDAEDEVAGRRARPGRRRRRPRRSPARPRRSSPRARRRRARCRCWSCAGSAGGGSSRGGRCRSRRRRRARRAQAVVEVGR